MCNDSQNAHRPNQTYQQLSADFQNEELQSIYSYQNINKKSEIRKGLTVK
jgi:hypothetical protein